MWDQVKLLIFSSEIGKVVLMGIILVRRKNATILKKGRIVEVMSLCTSGRWLALIGRTLCSLVCY